MYHPNTLLKYLFLFLAFSTLGVKAQESFNKNPELGIGYQFNKFNGELKSGGLINSPLSQNTGFNFYVRKPWSKTFGFDFSVNFNNRFLIENGSEGFANFHTKTNWSSQQFQFTLNLAGFYDDANKPLITPYLHFGAGLFFFKSFGDLYDTNGEKYHYWSDGSIRNLSETHPNAINATLLTRDFVYETELRSENHDGYGLYPQIALAFPVGTTVKYHFYKTWSVSLNGTMYLVQNDLIDDISTGGVGDRKGLEGNDKLWSTRISISYDFGAKEPANPAKKEEQIAKAEAKKEAKKKAQEEKLAAKEAKKNASQEEQAKAEAEALAKKEAEELAKKEAEKEAEEKARKEAEELAAKEAEEKAKKEAEELAVKEAEESTKKDTEAEIKNNAEGKGNESNTENEITSNSSTNATNNNESNEATNLASSSSNSQTGNGSFTIHIEKYNGGVPTKDLNKLLMIKGVKSKKDNNQSITFTSPGWSREEAEKELSKIKSQGFSNAYIIEDNAPKHTGQTYSSSNSIKETPVIKADGKVFYTVQIGAYRRDLSNSEKQKADPVQKEVLSNGVNRYYSGEFDNYSEALAHATKMDASGFDGAFVVAFKNGEKVSLSELGKGPARLAPVKNTQPSTINSDIVYKVQLGVFKEDIPFEILSVYKKIENVEQEVTKEGITRYTAGKFNNYEEAAKFKEIVINKGVSDCFVVAFYKGKLVTLQEAKALQGLN